MVIFSCVLKCENISCGERLFHSSHEWPTFSTGRQGEIKDRGEYKAADSCICIEEKNSIKRNLLCDCNAERLVVRHLHASMYLHVYINVTSACICSNPLVSCTHSSHIFVYSAIALQMHSWPIYSYCMPWYQFIDDSFVCNLCFSTMRKVSAVYDLFILLLEN